VLDRLTGELTVGAFRAGEALTRLAPRPVGMGLTSALARSFAVTSADKRLIVERNLRRVYGPQLRGARLAAKVNATFDSYARYYYDSFRLPTMSPEHVERGLIPEGMEYLEEAMAEDEAGPVMAIPHLGGWEWAAAYLHHVSGWTMAAVVEEIEPPELFEWFLEFRASLGANIIPLGPDAARLVAKAAADKEVLALLSDRDIAGNGVEVTFFGEKTTLPAGPALMAFRAGSRILPTAIYFQEGDGVYGVVRPPLKVERQGRLKEDIARVTQDLAYELEHLIRRAPEQWHLMVPNWPSDVEALKQRRRS
jgi:lauroyl/myristoyl acyltransferase